MPLTVFVGSEVKPDRGIVAFGSNHGNEYEGPTALKHLIREIDIGDVCGRIIIIPVLNISAFRSGTRESVDDDGVNLNRAFVDGAGKVPTLAGITHRIAEFVRDYIWPRIHVSIDLHAGGEVAKFALCSSFHNIEDPLRRKAVKETARWFGTPVILTYQNATPGLLPSECDRMGKISIGTELGWGQSINADGVRYAKHGVRAAAIHHDQMRGNIQPIGFHKVDKQIFADATDPACTFIAPYSGHYESLIECGTMVNREEIIGYLHDFDRIDEEPLPVTAGVSGVIVAQAWAARVRKGQHILVIGIIEKN
jgi:predicted deacylase